MADQEDRADHVLDLIDRTLGDNAVSDDAMRSVPEDVDLPDCRHERCLGHDSCQWVDDLGRPVLPAGEGDMVEVGYTTEGFDIGGIRVVGDERIPPDRFAVLHHGGEVVAAGPFPAPPPPLAMFTADAEGNIRDRHGNLILDAAATRRAVHTLGEVMRRWQEQVRPAVEAAGRRLAEATRGMRPPRALRPEATPRVIETPAERALRLRRERNTGPGSDTYRHRGMS